MLVVTTTSILVLTEIRSKEDLEKEGNLSKRLKQKQDIKRNGMVMVSALAGYIKTHAQCIKENRITSVFDPYFYIIIM